MNRKVTVAALWGALVLLPATVAVTTARASSSFGGLSGIARDATTGNPIADTQVAINGGPGLQDIRAVSSEDGTFAVALQPGHYTVTASKSGFQRATTAVKVSAEKTSRFDLELSPLALASVPAPSVSPAGEPSKSEIIKELELLKTRVEQLEAQLNKGGPEAVPVAASAASSTSAPPTAPAPPAQVAIAAIPKVSRFAGRVPAGYSSSDQPATSEDAGAKENFWKRWLSGNPESMQELASAAQTTENAKPEAEKGPVDPFSDYDWSWLNGNSRTKESPLDSKYFTGEFRADTHYGIDFNQPKDDTMGGSSEVFRSSEVQVEQISLGGDLHVDNVRGRILTMFGMFATTTPRNDASPGRGQWDLRDAYRYVSEAYGGYHFNVLHGINVDAGIFASYIGLFSYYNFDNWAYQPSYVSSNTPWFFNGVRVQIFPTTHLKIEPWFINGWQAYARPNGRPGLGGQIRWTPKPWLNLITNNYGLGRDAVGIPQRERIHTDNSVELKYYDNPKRYLDKAAFTFTGDLGCEYGGGVTCHGGKAGPKQAFLGYMIYNRFWFHNDLWAMTLGGGQINNPGRYLVLLPPINGADAFTGSPYFTENPGQPFKAYDATATFDYMPKQFITFRSEFGYRHANVPYFTGRQGITPPGGNNGDPASSVTLADGTTWTPDLRRSQPLLLFSIMVKF